MRHKAGEFRVCGSGSVRVRNAATSNNLATDAEISARNLYAFWVPLDEKFLEVMSKYSQVYNVVYVSPFEATNFLAYIDYASVPTCHIMKRGNMTTTKSYL